MTVVTLRADKGSPLTHNEVDDNFRNLYERLTADRTYYVDPDGSDDNDGLAEGTAFATIQHAIDTVAQLDLDYQYRVTVQLADGTHDIDPEAEFGVLFKDPLHSHLPTVEAFSTYTNLCLLRGKPAAPEDVVILAAGSLSTITAMRSTAWRVDGVRLQNDATATFLAYVNQYSTLILDDIDFHFTDLFQFGLYCRNYSYAETGPASEFTHCKISASVSAMPFVMFWAYDHAYIFTGADIDCQHTALPLLNSWDIASFNGYVWDYNNYFNAENITGRHFEARHGGGISFRRLDAFPGDVTGFVDGTSYLNPNNSNFGIPTSALPVADPVGGPLAGEYYESDLVQRNFNGKTITNVGAAALVQYNLPGGREDLYHFIGNDGTGPFGFQYSFVVQDAFGIRVSATGGFSIRNVGTVGGKIESTTIGSTLTLLNVAEFEWMVTNVLGTWAVTAQIANSVAPTVSAATATMADTITCSTGTWAASPATVYYQWLVDGEPIRRQITSSLSLPAVEVGLVTVGDVLTCRVSTIDAAGTGSVSVVTSNSCTVV
jgi:hypothetical protein